MEKDNPAWLNKYLEFITKLNPPTWWKITRFLLHWISLPIKLVIMSLMSLIMYLYMFTWRTRKIKMFTNLMERKDWFLYMYQSLPIFTTEFHQLYTNRVSYYELPNGTNHNDDHQGARHGVYTFLMEKLGINNKRIDYALGEHFQGVYGCIRGFKWNNVGHKIYNANETSGDQLIGLLLPFLEYEITSQAHSFNDLNTNLTIEKMEEAVVHIIKNDYAVRDAKGLRKSVRGMWQPGLETVGAQAITILAALAIAKKFGNIEAQKAYKKLIWKYGYGLLCLIPTTFWFGKRGYYNDNNCITAAYILARTSKSKWGKLYWSLIARYVWSLSKKWYNPYFTGMVKELLPWSISDKYVEQCKNLLYEQRPINYSREWGKEKEPAFYPVKFNHMNQGEFYPDMEHRLYYEGGELYRSGLGWFAAAVMIDPEEAKKFLTK